MEKKKSSPEEKIALTTTEIPLSHEEDPTRIHADDDPNSSHQPRENDHEKIECLEADINAAALALDLFFQNKISECMDVLKEKSDHGLYHSLGASAAQFIYSVLTFDRNDMNTATNTMHKAIEIAGKKRKRTNFTEFFWGSDVNDYTDDEIHAELCYAENHIMLGFLTFAQDQSIFTLIKAAYRIKVGNDTYRTCMEILNRKKEWKNDNLRKHFESGTCTGLGTANLILSHLPARALRTLKWAGFTGDRMEALRNLKNAAAIKDALRFKIVSLITISYNLYMEQFYGLEKGDLQWAVSLLDELGQQFPNGVIVLTFKGRLKQLNGETDQAIQCFQEAINVPIEWPSIRNICYWEQIWCYSVKGNWSEAAKLAKLLRTKSHWSRCVMTTLVATLTYMDMTDNNKPELKNEVVEEMTKIPKLRRRIGGRTIPMEKLALYISDKFFSQNEFLILPIYELFYFFNIFSHTGGRAEHLDPMLARLEEEMSKLCQENDQPPPENVDNYVLLLLLKGTALRYKKCLKQATECLLQVIQMQDKIQKNTYIPPHAALELGILYVEQDKLADAKEWLDRAKNDYKGFLVEVLVHMRIHAAQREVMDREKLLQVKESESSEILDPSSSSKQKKPSPNAFGAWIKSFV